MEKTVNLSDVNILWENLSVEELQSSPIYNSLTDQGKKIAGETRESILNFFKRDLFPFIHSNINTFVLEQIYDLDMEDFEHLRTENTRLHNATKDTCLASMKNMGVSAYMDMLKYIMAFFHYEELNLCKFIPIQIEADNYLEDPDFTEEESDYWEKKLINDLFEAFMFSRLQYLTEGLYMPIVLNTALNDVSSNTKMGHTVAYVFLPNSEDLSWHRIFIDSSNLSKLDVVYRKIIIEIEKSIQLAWDKYIQRLYIVQTDNEKIEKSPMLCSYNFQGAFSTCTHWSLVMTMHFLYNFKNERKYLMNANVMNMWCKNLEDFARLNRDKVMDVIIEFDTLMNNFLALTIFTPLSSRVVSDDNVLPSVQKALQNANQYVEKNIIDDILSKMSVSIKKLNILDYFSRMI